MMALLNPDIRGLIVRPVAGPKDRGMARSAAVWSGMWIPAARSLASTSVTLCLPKTTSMHVKQAAHHV
jgi:hypothetical protein